SPALKGKELCFYHEKNRPAPAELYMDGERYCDSQIMVPVVEDAHSIQTMIQLVVSLMLSRRIERKDAGLVLYGLQIASGNLKMLAAEKAKPTQVVVEPEKAAETPLGMTPWSASGEGHDREEEEEEPKEEGEESEKQDSPRRPPTVEECYAAMCAEERCAMREGFTKYGNITPNETTDFLYKRGPDPLLAVMQGQREAEACRSRK
ncbi:MAG: hypothetical protein WAL58_12905, partial [Terriglobales bacterium]